MTDRIVDIDKFCASIEERISRRKIVLDEIQVVPANSAIIPHKGMISDQLANIKNFHSHMKHSIAIRKKHATQEVKDHFSHSDISKHDLHSKNANDLV